MNGIQTPVCGDCSECSQPAATILARFWIDVDTRRRFTLRISGAFERGMELAATPTRQSARWPSAI